MVKMLVKCDETPETAIKNVNRKVQGAKSQHMTPRTTINACKIYKQMRKKSDKEQGKTKHSKNTK